MIQTQGVKPCDYRLIGGQKTSRNRVARHFRPIASPSPQARGMVS